MTKTKIKDLGMTHEEAIRKGVLFQCYQVLGKYYTAETFNTAPAVQLGQCPSCGEFAWEELTDNVGQCSECNFSG